MDCNRDHKSLFVCLIPTSLLMSGTMCTPTLLVMLLVFDIASQSMPAQDGRLPSHHNALHHHHPTPLSFAWQLSSQIFASSWNQDPSQAPADSERCQRGLHSVSLPSLALTLFNIMSCKVFSICEGTGTIHPCLLQSGIGDQPRKGRDSSFGSLLQWLAEKHQQTTNQRESIPSVSKRVPIEV